MGILKGIFLLLQAAYGIFIWYTKPDGHREVKSDKAINQLEAEYEAAVRAGDLATADIKLGELQRMRQEQTS